MSLAPFQVVTGTYTGTAAALSTGINSLGFHPVLVMAFNQTDGDLAWFHIHGQTAATAVSIDTEVAVETNACTLSNTGFSLGTSTVVNESGKVYVYLAIGGADAA